MGIAGCSRSTTAVGPALHAGRPGVTVPAQRERHRARSPAAARRRSARSLPTHDVPGGARGGRRTSPGWPRGTAVGESPAWRGQNSIPAEAARSCRQIDGGPASRSSRSAASTATARTARACWSATRSPGRSVGPGVLERRRWRGARLHLAGIIRYSMPYLDPGALTDAEALQVAAFINAQPRPVYPSQSLRLPVRPGPARQRLLSAALTTKAAEQRLGACEALRLPASSLQPHPRKFCADARRLSADTRFRA